MANEKILIIDRDDATANAIQLPLDAAGYRVFRTTNGDEGLRLVKQVQPDLIILDALSDETAEGYRMALVLSNPTPGSEYAAYHDIPIIMLRAIHDSTGLRVNPEEDYMPVAAFVHKPVGAEMLLDLVRHHLKSPA